MIHKRDDDHVRQGENGDEDQVQREQRGRRGSRPRQREVEAEQQDEGSDRQGRRVPGEPRQGEPPPFETGGGGSVQQHEPGDVPGACQRQK